METSHFLLGLFMIYNLLCKSWAVNMEFTVRIAAGMEDCFWESFPDQKELEIDYQVIDGGDRDINFRLISPQKINMVQEAGKTESLIPFTPTEKGDYGLCFDNTFSSFSSKVVYFDVYSAQDDADDEIDESKYGSEKSDLLDLLDMTMKEFLELMERLRMNLQRSIHIQGLLKIHEAKDRNTQESNFFLVNFFSSSQLICLVAIGITQVVLIRRLFQDPKKVSGGSLKQRT